MHFTLNVTGLKVLQQGSRPACEYNSAMKTGPALGVPCLAPAHQPHPPLPTPLAGRYNRRDYTHPSCYVRGGSRCLVRDFAVLRAVRRAIQEGNQVLSPFASNSRQVRGNSADLAHEIRENDPRATPNGASRAIQVLRGLTTSSRQVPGNFLDRAPQTP